MKHLINLLLLGWVAIAAGLNLYAPIATSFASDVFNSQKLMRNTHPVR